MYYSYDADGTLWKRTVLDKTNPRTYHYMNGVSYENMDLEYIGTSNGQYISTTEETINGTETIEGYQYVINDHLGNGRVWFMDKDDSGSIERNEVTNEVTQIQHYYPFGMSMNAPQEVNPIDPENRFKYNGKELEDDWGMYNYGARFYDPSIGRFTTTDRFAEKYTDLTPYHYGANNPIKFIDVNGDSLRVAFVGEDAELAKNQFYDEVNSALEGQYTLTATSTGNMQLSENCEGSCTDGLSEQGQAVYDELSNVMNSKGQVDITAENGRSDVHTGNYGKKMIDMADVLQFNSDKKELGGTRIGKIVHEVVEQSEMQINKRGYNAAHAIAIRAENKVNGSKRVDSKQVRNTQMYTRGGKTVTTRIDTKHGGAFGGGRRVISVTNY